MARDRPVVATSLQSDEVFLRNVELSWPNPLWFQRLNHDDTGRHHAPCTSRTSDIAGFVLNRRRLGALQCHSRPNLVALNERHTFNISPDDHLFDQ